MAARSASAIHRLRRRPAGGGGAADVGATPVARTPEVNPLDGATVVSRSIAQTRGCNAAAVANGRRNSRFRGIPAPGLWSSCDTGAAVPHGPAVDVGDSRAFSSRHVCCPHRELPMATLIETQDLAKDY